MALGAEMVDAIYQNDHFRIEHSSYYRIAGFLFVIPQQKVESISELTMPALERLGFTLSIAIQAVEAVIQPINIYCTKFGESNSGLHFHIFPRTQTLTEAYQAETGFGPEVDGPHLMSWANKHYNGTLEHGNIVEATQALGMYFEKIA